MANVVRSFLGVFSPKGELEAVEASPAMAEFAALNLSPIRDGHRRLNRTVEPVVVLRGRIAEAVATYIEDQEADLAAKPDK